MLWYISYFHFQILKYSIFLKDIQGGVVIFYLWLFPEIQFPHHWRSFHLCSKFPNPIFQISQFEIEIHFHAGKDDSWNIFPGQILSIDPLELFHFLQWYSESKWKWRSVSFRGHVCSLSSLLLKCPTQYSLNDESRPNISMLWILKYFWLYAYLKSARCYTRLNILRMVNLIFQYLNTWIWYVCLAIHQKFKIAILGQICVTFCWYVYPQSSCCWYAQLDSLRMVNLGSFNAGHSPPASPISTIPIPVPI